METQKIKKSLLEKFEKDSNDFHYFLGIEVIRTLDRFIFSRRLYVLHHFDSKGCWLGKQRILQEILLKIYVFTQH